MLALLLVQALIFVLPGFVAMSSAGKAMHATAFALVGASAAILLLELRGRARRWLVGVGLVLYVSGIVIDALAVAERLSVSRWILVLCALALCMIGVVFWSEPGERK